MKLLIYSILLFISVLLQVSLMNYIAIGGVSPDLSIIMIGFTALGLGRNYSTLLGFLTGFLRDSFGYSIIGMGSLIFSICGFAAGTFIQKRSFYKWYELATVFAILIFVYFFLDYFLVNFSAETFWKTIFANIIPQFLYTLFILIVMLFVLPKKIWIGKKDNIFD
ncbi:rod shape-determining protein MreD [candidate division KSB1 bacterium]|nr:rod shape-determining protein MreD [candidate division KSB1 bacterium]